MRRGHLTISFAAVLAFGIAAAGQAHAVASPVFQPTPVSVRLGDSCIGADIGRTAVDPAGNRIICNNYSWQINRGQQARHPWADEQTAWSSCIQQHTTAECRQRLNH